MTTLEFTKRDGAASADSVRKEGNIPAVFYGPKEASQSISISSADFLKVYDEAGESSIVTLKSGSEEHDVLIHDVQFDPVKSTPIHADFYVIEKGKKVNVDVSLVFEGVAPAEKSMGGVLVKVMHELEIEALPKDLPHEIKVDISPLVDFDTVIYAKDITLPEGVELITDPEETVVLVQEPKEEEETPVTAPDLDSIKVEEKGKKEDDSEGEGKSE